MTWARPPDLLWVVQAVYGVLKEAEHRSTFYIPYWNLPFAKNLVPRQRKFYADLAVINDCLDDLIAQAKNTRQTDDAEALQARDYSKVPCPWSYSYSFPFTQPHALAVCPCRLTFPVVLALAPVALISSAHTARRVCALSLLSPGHQLDPAIV